MSDSPQSPQKSHGEENNSSQYNTANIGRWASKQENPFAAQNRKANARKQESDRKRQKTAPIIAAILGIIMAGAAVWGLVILVIHLINLPVELTPDNYTPEISGSSAEDINAYRELLQDFYDDRRNNDDVLNDDNPSDISQADQDQLCGDINKIVQNTLNTSAGQENASAVILAQMTFGTANGCYQQVIDAAQKIDTAQLDPERLSIYYNLLANSYLWSGDRAKAEEYFNKSRYGTEGE